MFTWSKVYIIRADIPYMTRYDKRVTARKGFHCDGASGPASDIDSDSWKIHDWLFVFGRFDDGSRCTFKQANVILKDILHEEGHSKRAILWYIGVYAGGRGAWAARRREEMMCHNMKFFFSVDETLIKAKRTIA